MLHPPHHEKSPIGFPSADFIHNHKLSRMHRLVNCRNADPLNRRKIKPVFSHSLGGFEIHMGKHSLPAVECDNFESGALTTLADFLSVKTASRHRQILHNTL